MGNDRRWEITREELYALIDAFLEERRLSADSGYAPVTTEDEIALNEIVGGLIHLKFEPDVDGDRPLLWLLVHRAREYMPYDPIRHDYPYTLEGALDRLSDSGTNMRIAHREFDLALHYYRGIRDEQEDRALEAGG